MYVIWRNFTCNYSVREGLLPHSPAALKGILACSALFKGESKPRKPLPKNQKTQGSRCTSVAAPESAAVVPHIAAHCNPAKRSIDAGEPPRKD